MTRNRKRTAVKAWSDADIEYMWESAGGCKCAACHLGYIKSWKDRVKVILDIQRALPRRPGGGRKGMTS